MERSSIAPGAKSPQYRAIRYPYPSKQRSVNQRHRMVRYNNKDANSTNTSLCIFSALYAPSMGGVEMYTESLARALADAGCKVTIVTMNTHNAKSYERDGNVEIIRLPALNVLGGRYPLPKLNTEYRAAMERLIKSHPNYVVVNIRYLLPAFLLRKSLASPLCLSSTDQRTWQWEAAQLMQSSKRSSTR